MGVGIKLSIATARWVQGDSEGMRLRVEVAEAYNVSDKIFAYRLLPTDPTTGVSAGSFSHVCSPADLEDYPENAPTGNTVPAWYRLNYVDLLLHSAEEAETMKTQIQEDVQLLIDQLNALASLQPSDEVDLGDVPPPPPTYYVFDNPCDINDPATQCVEVTSGGPPVSGTIYALPDGKCYQFNGATCAGPPDQVGGITAYADCNTCIGSQPSYGNPTSVSSYGSISYELPGEGNSWTKVGAGAGSPTLADDANSSQYEEVVIHPRFASKQLLIQGFNFDDLVPAGAAIDGIQVDLVVSNPNATGNAPPDTETSLAYLSLYHPTDGPKGTVYQGQWIGGPGWNTLTFGGANDLWGVTWTDDDLRRGDFGVLLAVRTDSIDQHDTVRVDGAQITVTYRPLQ